MQIYKYTIPAQPGEHIVTLPVGPIIDVQAQHEQIVLWIPANKETTTVRFLCVETGAEFDHTPNLFFLKTVQLYEGRYVLHVFQVE